MRNMEVRALTDEERDRMAQHVRIAYKYMPNKRYTPDEQQSAWIHIIHNWTRNRERCNGIQDVTFVGQSARFRAYRAKSKAKHNFDVSKCLTIHGTGGPDDRIDPLSSIAPPDETVAREDELTLMRKCYGVLNEREKTIVSLYNQGYNQTEIGARLGVSKRRIWQLFGRIVQVLRTAMEAENAKAFNT